MSDLSKPTRNTIIALGLAQGVLLLAAHMLIDREILGVPAHMIWLLPWYAIAIGVPTALQLVATDVRDRRLWLFGLGLAAVLAFTGAYSGYAVEPSVEASVVPAVFPYILTTFIGWYVLLPFVQAYFKTGTLRPEYPDLFEFAWNNVITLKIAGIFTGIFWGLLALWAALFDVIGIKFFAELFYNKYFAYPVTTTVFASALYLGRSNVSAVVTVRRIILAVFKALLPLLAVIILLFLAALPFMGLKPLWATGKATALLLTLQILLMIFLNAVYQNGKGPAPYPHWLRTLVRAAVVVLPICTALCIYALYLRIDQHGWSTDRFWAVLLTFVVGLHVASYAVAALRHSRVWMAGIATGNVAIAAVTVALSVLVNSPILDAQRISVASQVGRLLAGKVAADDFDYRYLRFELGRRGNAALARLNQLSDHPQAATIRTGAQEALLQTRPWGPQGEKSLTAAQAAAHFSVYPRGERLEDSFIHYAMDRSSPWDLKNCLAARERCVVLVVDLNRDQRKEYVVFRVVSRWDHSAPVLGKFGTEWRLAGNLHVKAAEAPQSLEELETQLAKGDYAVAENPWNNLRIGKQTQRFRPE